MKLLVAATPLTGHVNPLLAVARLAATRGDEVVMTTSEAFRGKVEAAGLRFAPLAGGAAAGFRETGLPAGPERSRREFIARFITPMADQARTLRALIAQEAPDVIVAGSMVLGVLPLLLDPRPRPPIVTLNISFLFLDRPDGAPVGLGLPPVQDARYAAFKARVDAAFVDPVRAAADAALAGLGLPGLPASLTQSIASLPDAFVQMTVPDFEYEYGRFLPPQVRFVGTLPAPAAEGPMPEWWGDLDGGRRIVLVTQGTLANGDLSELVEPTLAALSHREDLLVLATTGGRPVASLEGPLPANARVAPFLPFGALLPKVSVLVTNGGYGSVSMALSAGVPLVSAGLTEDKAEIGARIAWSGAGLDLAANAPTVEALREGIESVLADPRYRQCAGDLATAFARHDAGPETLDVIDGAASVGLRRHAA